MFFRRCLTTRKKFKNATSRDANITSISQARTAAMLVRIFGDKK
jgi:hypothetical protein